MAWDQLWSNNSKAGSFCFYCEVCKMWDRPRFPGSEGMHRSFAQAQHAGALLGLQEGLSLWCDGAVTGCILADLRYVGDPGPQKPGQAGFVHTGFDF